MMSKNFNDLQKDILDFSVKREWTKNELILTYNMLCNISEECGEVWNLIKWLNDPEDFKKIVKMKKAEFKDGIGDLLWCVARMANAFGVDMQESLQATLDEYEERFPIEMVKGNTGNRLLGGYDGKYDKKK